MVDIPEYLVLDGAMGSEAVRRDGNKSITYSHPMWSSDLLVSNEGRIKEIHRDFLEAGADVIMTNTYKPTVENFMDYYSISRVEATEVFRKAARIACTERDIYWESIKDKQTGRRKPMVVAALGPFGACTKEGTDYAGLYVDKTSIETMVEANRPRIQALIEGGVEMLGFETIPAVKEAQAIYKVMEYFPNTKAWLAFCCKDGEHVSHGETFQEAVESSLSCDQIVAVGINCSSPLYISSLLQHIPLAVRETKKIVVYPNDGQIFNPKDKYWEGEKDNRPLHEYVPEWIQYGANWIGGCCNVEPRHITLIRQKMESYLKKEVH